MAAKLSQATALANIAQAGKSPTVVAGGSNDLGILMNWELDLWGKLQRNIEANEAFVAASQADLAAAKLSLQAQLAKNYFLLRVQDEELSLLQNTVFSYESSLQITRNQYDAGVANSDNIAQAQGQLSSAKVQLFNAQITRAQLEHSLAILTGKAPSDFSLPAKSFAIQVPIIPETLPADLLNAAPILLLQKDAWRKLVQKLGLPWHKHTQRLAYLQEPLSRVV
ncbi:TolC family protein [Psychromonas sp. MME2]